MVARTMFGLYVISLIKYRKSVFLCSFLTLSSRPQEANDVKITTVQTVKYCVHQAKG